MLGADEPATASISSIVALPVRSKNLMISSERLLIDSDILPDFNLPAERGSNHFFGLCGKLKDFVDISIIMVIVLV